MNTEDQEPMGHFTYSFRKTCGGVTRIEGHAVYDFYRRMWKATTGNHHAWHEDPAVAGLMAAAKQRGYGHSWFQRLDDVLDKAACDVAIPDDELT